MTKIIKANELNDAAECIKNGGTVVFPTETVYGLGADAYNEIAIDKIYKAKGRPGDNPLIVHIADKEDIYKLSSEVTKNAVILMDAFWPGALTIILKKDNSVPYRVTGGLDTVAVRNPSNPVANALIKESGKFIAAPSANLSGSPSPTTAKHVIDDLDGRVDYIICDDMSEIGLESTVIDLSSDIPTILRPGAITIEMIREYLPDVTLDAALSDKSQKPKSPGMKYKHYSPKATVEVVTGSKEKMDEYISKKLESMKNCGVMTYMGGDFDNAKCILSSGHSMEEYASKLFYNLRVFDEYGVSHIFAEFIDEGGIGTAVKNRLYKAAGNNITKV